jgi:small subunit ribosomal protein S6
LTNRENKGKITVLKTNSAQSNKGVWANTKGRSSDLNQYEIAVLYHPDLEIDLEKATSKVEKILADNKAKVVKADNWGKRKLAYSIAKQEYAVYVFYTVEIPAENIRRVEQTFNITDEVIRFLITRPDLKAQAKAEALKVDKAKKAAERGDRDDDESKTDEE